ncbi:MAG TPA: LPS export ABC transporter periplasmic protein LptC [Hyphomicrobiales bacterium]|nr:LPS export ABC transporter periplasmic protein LptC [Hyphomicrobiales bacterium]
MAYAAMPGQPVPAVAKGIGSPSRNYRIEREREFLRARRHSKRVAALKVLLPLLACGILSLYVVPSFFTVSIDHGRGTATVRGVALEAGALKMLEPHVKGVNEKGDAYDFVADSATQASRQAEVLFLDNVRGKLIGHDGRVSTLTAPNGIHNSKEDKMIFNNGALVTREPGMTATFQTAVAFMKQQIVDSRTPVVVRLQESTIHADSMILYWGEQRAVFEGHVRTHVERQPASETAGHAEPGSGNGGSRALGLDGQQ